MSRKYHNYRPRLRTRARHLRNNMTRAEIRLWKAIKGRQLGVEFLRQTPIDRFIVDFFCKEPQMVIEVDGSSHHSAEAYRYDQWRQRRLESLGITVLRFENSEVFSDLEGVVRAIRNWIERLGGQPEPRG